MSDNAYDLMRRAIYEAREKMNAADSAAGSIADLLRGRLRKGVPAYILKDLKRELRDFNIHTGNWKKGNG